MHYVELTTPRVWWQEMYVSCYAVVSVFCGILRAEVRQPHNANRPGVLTTPEAVLTIATYVGGARL